MNSYTHGIYKGKAAIFYNGLPISQEEAIDLLNQTVKLKQEFSILTSKLTALIKKRRLKQEEI
ncbi:MAG: hypothetical protein COA94_05015 [Rickettsiales bacterium]|nr:MAG: hypothetical protein COA94_05015 [Rickettsiales bacterium]